MRHPYSISFAAPVSVANRRTSGAHGSKGVIVIVIVIVIVPVIVRVRVLGPWRDPRSLRDNLSRSVFARRTVPRTHPLDRTVSNCTTILQKTK
jgi:hypothetical protein